MWYCASRSPPKCTNLLGHRGYRVSFGFRSIWFHTDLPGLLPKQLVISKENLKYMKHKPREYWTRKCDKKCCDVPLARVCDVSICFLCCKRHFITCGKHRGNWDTNRIWRVINVQAWIIFWRISPHHHGIASLKLTAKALEDEFPFWGPHPASCCQVLRKWVFRECNIINFFKTGFWMFLGFPDSPKNLRIPKKSLGPQPSTLILGSSKGAAEGINQVGDVSFYQVTLVNRSTHMVYPEGGWGRTRPLGVVASISDVFFCWKPTVFSLRFALILGEFV